MGVALLATVLTSRLSAHNATLQPGGDTAGAVDAFQEAFIVAAVLTAFGALAALLISDCWYGFNQLRGGWEIGGLADVHAPNAA